MNLSRLKTTFSFLLLAVFCSMPVFAAMEEMFFPRNGEFFYSQGDFFFIKDDSDTVLKSSDSCKTWEHHSTEAMTHVAPFNKDLVFKGANSYSLDGGESWAVLNDDGKGLVGPYFTSNTVYFKNVRHGYTFGTSYLYKFTPEQNKITTVDHVDSTLNYTSGGYNCYFDYQFSRFSDQVYRYNKRETIYSTIDSIYEIHVLKGDSWVLKNDTILKNFYYDNFHYDASDKDHWYYSSSVRVNDTGRTKIYETTDGGKNWELIHSIFPKDTSDRWGPDVYYNPVQDLFYYQDYDGVYSWNGSEEKCIYKMPDEATVNYVIVEGDMVLFSAYGFAMISQDKGSNWRFANPVVYSGNEAPKYFYAWGDSIKYRHTLYDRQSDTWKLWPLTDDGEMTMTDQGLLYNYYDGDSGIYSFDDEACKPKKISVSPEEYDKIVHYRGDTLLLRDGNSLRLSKNNGLTWSEIAPPEGFFYSRKYKDTIYYMDVKIIGVNIDSLNISMKKYNISTLTFEPYFDSLQFSAGGKYPSFEFVEEEGAVYFVNEYYSFAYSVHRFKDGVTEQLFDVAKDVIEGSTCFDYINVINGNILLTFHAVSESKKTYLMPTQGGFLKELSQQMSGGVIHTFNDNLCLYDDNIKDGVFFFDNDFGVPILSNNSIKKDRALSIHPYNSGFILDLPTGLKSDPVITLFSMNGRVVYKANPKNIANNNGRIHLDLSDRLATGMYLVNVIADDYRATEQIMIGQ